MPDVEETIKIMELRDSTGAVLAQLMPDVTRESCEFICRGLDATAGKTTFPPYVLVEIEVKVTRVEKAKVPWGVFLDSKMKGLSS